MSARGRGLDKLSCQLEGVEGSSMTPTNFTVIYCLLYALATTTQRTSRLLAEASPSPALLVLFSVFSSTVTFLVDLAPDARSISRVVRPMGNGCVCVREGGRGWQLEGTGM